MRTGQPFKSIFRHRRATQNFYDFQGSTGGIAPRGLGASAPTCADIAVSEKHGTEAIRIGSTCLAGVGAGAPLGSGITAHRIITSGRPGLFPGGGGGAAGSTAIGALAAPGFIIVEY